MPLDEARRTQRAIRRLKRSTSRGPLGTRRTPRRFSGGSPTASARRSGLGRGCRKSSTTRARSADRRNKGPNRRKLTEAWYETDRDTSSGGAQFDGVAELVEAARTGGVARGRGSRASCAACGSASRAAGRYGGAARCAYVSAGLSACCAGAARSGCIAGVRPRRRRTRPARRTRAPAPLPSCQSIGTLGRRALA